MVWKVGKVDIYFAFMIVMLVIVLGGSFILASLEPIEPIEHIETNLADLQENPEAYVGKNVTFVGRSKEIFIDREEVTPITIKGTEDLEPEGTIITLDGVDETGLDSMSIWYRYTGSPLDIDRFSDIKITGILKRDPRRLYSFSNYVIIADKIEVLK